MQSALDESSRAKPAAPDNRPRAAKRGRVDQFGPEATVEATHQRDLARAQPGFDATESEQTVDQDDGCRPSVGGFAVMDQRLRGGVSREPEPEPTVCPANDGDRTRAQPPSPEKFSVRPQASCCALGSGAAAAPQGSIRFDEQGECVRGLDGPSATGAVLRQREFRGAAVRPTEPAAPLDPLHAPTLDTCIAK